MNLEPLKFTFARIGDRAAIKIRPQVSGDLEYWRLREAIVETLWESEELKARIIMTESDKNEE